GRSEITLGVALQLPQNEGRDFRRRECLLTELDAQYFTGGEIFCQPKGEELQLVLYVFETAAHESFHAVYCMVRRFDQILARRIADDDLAVLIKSNDRRHQIHAILAW